MDDNRIIVHCEVKDSMSRKWFGKKLFGVGIGPRTWEGWLATGVYLCSLLLVAEFLEASFTTKFLIVAMVSAAFIGLIWLTYDRSSHTH